MYLVRNAVEDQLVPHIMRMNITKKRFTVKNHGETGAM